MMAFVVLFDHIHCRHRFERFAAVTAMWDLIWPAQRLLDPHERANRLYAMGELAAAAELLVKTKASAGGAPDLRRSITVADLFEISEPRP